MLRREVVRKLKLYVPAQNSSSLNSLNAVLGQAGLNSFEFSKLFTSLTKNYEMDVILRVDVFIFADKKFELKVEPPAFSFIVNEELLLTGVEEGSLRVVPLSLLYKIAFMLSTQKGLGMKGVHMLVKSFFGTLKSMRYNVVNDLK
jgi:ribosomal protein L11